MFCLGFASLAAIATRVTWRRGGACRRSVLVVVVVSWSALSRLVSGWLWLVIGGVALVTRRVSEGRVSGWAAREAQWAHLAGLPPLGVSPFVFLPPCGCPEHLTSLV